MKIFTLDAETFYDENYTLKKYTTEAYVRDSKFECIMFGIKEGDKPAYTVVGKDIADALHGLELHKHACVFHHAHFDALILSHQYGIRPKIILDTLAMGRAEVGSVASRGMSLESLGAHLGVGVKGHEVVLAKGKHAGDFTPEELENYRRYCCNDVDLTWAIYTALGPRFCIKEVQLIDLTTRLFTEPVLELNRSLLEEYKALVLANKDLLLAEAGVDRAALTSNPKFAVLLSERGITPATHPDMLKDSKTATNEDGTPKKTFAFAKGDPFMMNLLECDSEEVQALAEARVGVKTSIAETRAQRLIDMQQNGAACVYLNYWGAEQTGRHSGGGRCNFQNLGRSQAVEAKHTQHPIFTPAGRADILDVGAWGLTDLCTTTGYWPTRKVHRIGLRDCVQAPEGYVLVVGDSSNIEARMVCWLAGQEDILQQYREGADLYCLIASDIYGRTITKEDTKARQLGKVVTLGCGFGMGKAKFFDTATGAQWRIDIDRSTTDTAVEAFRAKYYEVAAYWRFLNDQVIPAMASGREMWADKKGTIRTTRQGFIMPNGRPLRYPNLHQRKNPDPDSFFKTEWVFDIREGSRILKARTYGGHACIAEGTKVLTDFGWVNIELITRNHKVHDGVDFVTHGGLVYKSVQNCIPVDGVWMTPDHEVLTHEGWKPALEKPRPYRPDIRYVDRDSYRKARREKDAVGIYVSVWNRVREGRLGNHKRSEEGENTKLRLRGRANPRRETKDTRYVAPSGIPRMAEHEIKMHTSHTPSMEELRGTGNYRVRRRAKKFRVVLAGHGRNIRARSITGSKGQRARIHPDELLLGNKQAAEYESARRYRGGHRGHIRRDGGRQDHAILPTETRATPCVVYDILDCGPKHRFVVRGEEAPFIVHNCENLTQAAARIVVMDQAVEISKRYKVALLVHDEVVCCVPEEDAEECEKFMLGVMSTPPVWAPDLPIAAETGINRVYSLAK